MQAFRWNSASVSSDNDEDEDAAEEGLLCPTCRAPMTLDKVASLRTLGKPTDGSEERAPCCRSCAHQLADVLQPSSAALPEQVGMQTPDMNPSLPPFMRLRIEALRTGVLLDPDLEH